MCIRDSLGEQRTAEFFEGLLERAKLCTDVLVLDEVLYVSWRRYGVRYEDTAAFLDEIVLPYVRVLSVGREEYERARGYLGILRPSDALHVAAMLNNGVRVIVSEDRDFDKVTEIRRVWVWRAPL